MADEQKPGFIPELEIEDAQIKWAFSHFDGREDMFNEKGAHNFQVILPPDRVEELREQGWSIREIEGYEEGDPPEYLLKVKISYRFEPPKIYLIKNGRKFRAEESDLSDINRQMTERIDVIITPSRWVHGPNSGISAYCKEMYAVIKESRFAERYGDYEEVR